MFINLAIKIHKKVTSLIPSSDIFVSYFLISTTVFLHAYNLESSSLGVIICNQDKSLLYFN